MKIAVIGTHSTGKTTLLKKMSVALEEFGERVIILPEMARLCPMPINEETTLAAQQWILERQIEQEKRIRDDHTIVLCDRATIDNYAYFLRASWKTRHNLDMARFEKMAVEHMPSYDLVIKTRKLSLASKADGERSVNEYFRDEIDELISALLKKYNISYFLLPPTIDYDVHVQLIKERLNKVLSIVNA